MDWKKALIRQESTVKDAIFVIDGARYKIAVVTNEEYHVLGTITDGDIRRGILKGISLEAPVKEVMNVSPTLALAGSSIESMLETMRSKHLFQIPVVDIQGRMVGMQLNDDIGKLAEKSNWIVIMAGGLGTRLHPYTQDCPKPMLKVGGKPILETLIENFTRQGFRKIFISVNYLSDMIQNYFQDGSRFGAEITYIEEGKKLGTAGSLSLLPSIPTNPILVMNGDLLTKVNGNQLLEFHEEHKATATMAVREYDFQVPFGVVDVDQHRLVGIQEKPVHSFFVNAGIYAVEPSVLAQIPKNTFYDMPTVFNELIQSGRETAVFPIREYWVDIGQHDDFDKAKGEYQEKYS